jgi:hypothetical protein
MLHEQMLNHLRPSVAASSSSPWRSARFFVVRLWREVSSEFLSSYRPELHYMRGPGPRWQEKHGAVLRRTIRTNAEEPMREEAVALRATTAKLRQ